jgi:hypothetical protein
MFGLIYELCIWKKFSDIRTKINHMIMIIILVSDDEFKEVLVWGDLNTDKLFIMG